MKYTRLGKTGLNVSRICLGCMSYGVPGRGAHEWSLDEETTRPFVVSALEQGINFFDTANVYSDGTSEEFIGRAIADLVPREEVVVATKLNGRMRKDANGGGLSRKAVFAEIDNSLRRLSMDYVDLYQIHRWDNETPIEETLEALTDVVKAGKALYIGASSMYAWQFCKALHLSDQYGWSRFVSMQDHYNLLYREEEREMLPLCAAEGIGVIPWSPLGRGRLARPIEQQLSTQRSSTDEFGKKLYSGEEESNVQIINAVGEIAGTRGVSRAQIALAWMLNNSTITSPIVGATKPYHLEDAVAAVEISLTPEEISKLEAHYTPRAIAGFG